MKPASQHIRDYHKWLIEHHAVSHITAWRNFKYQERCAAERKRRSQADLIVTSFHEPGRGHMECQSEYTRWFYTQFGHEPEIPGVPKLIWSHGGGTSIGTNSHHWLVENPAQQMMTKLRWAL